MKEERLISLDDINNGYSTLKGQKKPSNVDKSHLYGIYV